MKTTQDIAVGSTVKVINAGPYRLMTGTVVGLNNGQALVALIEAAGSTLCIRVLDLAAA
jgi:hypothetical protein